MFTGIVQELGRIEAVETVADSVVLTISGPIATAGAREGDSIAVNGVCLTVVTLPDATTFTTDVIGETLRLSSLAEVAPGKLVNLERAVTATGHLDGHIVQGHVDGVGTVLQRERHPHWEVVRVEIPRELRRYVVHKGSITLDGTSLTVSGLSDEASWIEVSLIPTTLTASVIGTAAVGSTVNIEVDVIAKYVERLVNPPQ